MQVFMKLTRRVEAMAAKDGIVNHAERRLIDFLKFLRLPLFIFELVGWLAIVNIVIKNMEVIEFKVRESENYCEQGIWNICLIITSVYTLVFLFRIVIIVASLVGKEDS